MYFQIDARISSFTSPEIVITSLPSCVVTNCLAPTPTKPIPPILESKSKMLFFKEKYQEPGVRKRGALDNLYEFIGPVNYVKHFWIDEKDKEGRLRKVVKFVLEVEE